MTVETNTNAEFAPETPPKGPLVWMRDNLFSTPFNGVLSVVSIVVILLLSLS